MDRFVRSSTLVLFTVLFGCDDGKAEPAAVPSAAFDVPVVDQKAAAKGLQQKKKEADAKSEEIAVAAQKEFDARFDKVTTLPAEKLPLGRACDELGDAMDGLMGRLYEDDAAGAQSWTDKRDDSLKHLRKVCRKHSEADVATCQVHALRNAHDDMLAMSKELMDRCREKYGPPPTADDEKSG